MANTMHTCVVYTNDGDTQRFPYGALDETIQYAEELHTTHWQNVSEVQVFDDRDQVVHNTMFEL